MGSIVPISLFANITEISIVFLFINFSSSSNFTIPLSSTSTYEILNPSFSRDLQVSSTAGCSILDVIIWFPLLLYALAIPFIAVLSLSLPHEVKYISLGFAPIIFAISSLASSIAHLDFCPKLYIDDAFA